MACETVCTFLKRFFTFFSKSKKHDFLRFFELLHTFSRTVSPVADRRYSPLLNRWSRGCRSALLVCTQRKCACSRRWLFTCAAESLILRVLQFPCEQCKSFQQVVAITSGSIEHQRGEDRGVEGFQQGWGLVWALGEMVPSSHCGYGLVRRLCPAEKKSSHNAPYLGAGHNDVIDVRKSLIDAGRVIH